MFRLDESDQAIQEALYEAERNYTIQPNDWLEVFLFYNGGEQLIDPNARFLGQQSNNNALNQNRQTFEYLIQQDGYIKLPMIGKRKVAGLTIDQAEKELEAAYNEFYKDSFLKLKYLNKRVTVLGAVNTVVPIENENTSLLEVIAMAGGIQFGDKAGNIRVIRGDFNNPDIFVVDLTSIEGMKSSMITINPGDVVYIEPWRRSWLQVLRDVSPIIGVTSSVSTLIFLLVNSLNN